jgi:ABC-2 type transport system ATP-binding protein
MARLEIDGVTKRYGDTVAVDDISFDASPGRILGLLGPNGAGKTSTIRMITYITGPDQGAVRYDDRPVGPWSQQRMGYLPEERGLYKKLKVREQLLYLGELKGLARTTATDRADHWLERFEATDWASMDTEELSKGMQQKVQFIATLLHNPSLLIFDEPFSGLDPINSELLRDIILELRDDGRTILFASHRMEQVEQLCDDICLMAEGEIVLQGALRAIKSRFGRNSLILEFEGDDGFVDDLVAEGHVRIETRSRHRARLHLNDGASARHVLDTALDRTDTVYRFERVEPSMNEIFIEVVGEERARKLRAADGRNPAAA